LSTVLLDQLDAAGRAGDAPGPLDLFERRKPRLPHRAAVRKQRQLQLLIGIIEIIGRGHPVQRIVTCDPALDLVRAVGRKQDVDLAPLEHRQKVDRAFAGQFEFDQRVLGGKSARIGASRWLA
jgi:hypothetical protein